MNKEIVCAKCNTDPICPQCNYDKFNRPLVVKYITEEMAIIISTCAMCHVELFKSMTYQSTTLHKSFCLACIGVIETAAWKYRELSK
jgi:hypothetical protein